MKPSKTTTLILSLLLVNTLTYGLTPDEVLKKVEENYRIHSQKIVAKMIIKKEDRIMEKTFIGYASEDNFAITFTNPEDKGVKYLKIQNNLWIYFPDVKDTLKISGHMLKQGFMGSDISYEDMLKEEKLKEMYLPTELSETNINSKKYLLLTLTAKPEAKNIGYYQRILLVDPETFVPMEIWLCSKGGQPLKYIKTLKTTKIKDRYIITELIYKDLRRKDSQTIFTIEEIDIDIPIPKSFFSKQWLYK